MNTSSDLCLCPRCAAWIPRADNAASEDPIIRCDQCDTRFTIYRAEPISLPLDILASLLWACAPPGWRKRYEQTALGAQLEFQAPSASPVTVVFATRKNA